APSAPDGGWPRMEPRWLDATRAAAGVAAGGGRAPVAGESSRQGAGTSATHGRDGRHRRGVGAARGGAGGGGGRHLERVLLPRRLPSPLAFRTGGRAPVRSA